MGIGKVSNCKANCHKRYTNVNKATKQHLYYLNIINNKKHGCE